MISRTVKRWIMGLGIIMVFSFVSGCGLVPKEDEVLAPPLVKPKQQEYELYTVKKGDIKNALKGLATLTPGSQESLSFKESGSRFKGYTVELGDDVKKGQILAELETGDLDNRIKQAQYDYRIQQLSLQAKQKAFDVFKASGAVQSDIDQRSIDLQIEKIRTEKALYNLNELKNAQYKAKLTSPINGKVVFKAGDIKSGDGVEPYKTLVEVADPSHLQLVYQSTDTDKLNAVKVGMKAQVTIPGRTTPMEGEVVMCPSSLPVDTQPEAKSQIIIRVKNLPDNLKMGDMIDFTIDLEKKENVVVIPTRGLRTYVGHSFVEVYEDGSKKEFDVEVGIKNATEVEIVTGLKEGQQIILK